MRPTPSASTCSRAAVSIGRGHRRKSAASKVPPSGGPSPARAASRNSGASSAPAPGGHRPGERSRGQRLQVADVAAAGQVGLGRPRPEHHTGELQPAVGHRLQGERGVVESAQAGLGDDEDRCLQACARGRRSWCPPRRTGPGARRRPRPGRGGGSGVSSATCTATSRRSTGARSARRAAAAGESGSGNRAYSCRSVTPASRRTTSRSPSSPASTPVCAGLDDRDGCAAGGGEGGHRRGHDGLADPGAGPADDQGAHRGSSVADVRAEGKQARTGRGEAESA